MKIILDIRSEGKKEFEVLEETANKLKDLLSDDKISGETMIDINELNSFKKRKIDGMKILKELKQEEDIWQKRNQDWNDYVKMVRNLPIEKRFKENYFKFRCWFLVNIGRKSTQEDDKLAEKWALIYFKKHPEEAFIPYIVWEEMCKVENIIGKKLEIIKSFPIDEYRENLSEEDKKDYDYIMNNF